MAKKSDSSAYLKSFRDYLSHEGTEKARQHNLYPLFADIFKDKLQIESGAQGADIYVDGQLIVGAKTNFSQWTEGFYQALHYHRKFGLNYNTIMVVATNFVGIWKLNNLPEYATVLAHTADAKQAPNVVGKENAKKTISTPPY